MTDDWDRIGEYTHHAVSSSSRQCCRQRTTGEVQHVRDSTTSPAEGCVCCCTSPCASLCVLLCPRLSTLQHYCIPRTDPTVLQRLHPTAASHGLPPRPLDSTHAMLTLQPDQGEEVHTPCGHMTVM